MAGEYDLITNFDNLFQNRMGQSVPIVANPDLGPLDVSALTKDTLSPVPTISGSSTASALTDPNRGLGLNIPTLQLGFGALNSIGNLYAAFQSNALAKKQFNFQKNAYNQNLTNSIQSYNTALADRARSRAVMEGQTDAQRDAYVSENSLKKI